MRLHSLKELEVFHKHHMLWFCDGNKISLLAHLTLGGEKLLSWLKEDEIGSTQQKISTHIHIAKDFSPNQQFIIF